MLAPDQTLDEDGPAPVGGEAVGVAPGLGQGVCFPGFVEAALDHHRQALGEHGGLKILRRAHHRGRWQVATDALGNVDQPVLTAQGELGGGGQDNPHALGQQALAVADAQGQFAVQVGNEQVQPVAIADQQQALDPGLAVIPGIRHELGVIDQVVEVDPRFESIVGQPDDGGVEFAVFFQAASHAHAGAGIVDGIDTAQGDGDAHTSPKAPR